MSAPHEAGTQGRHPVVGWKEGKIKIPPQSRFLPGLHSYHLNLIRLAALETCVGGEEILDSGHDGAWSEESCRPHGLQLALTCPVGDSSEMVDVAMADHDRGHGRQRAVCAARVKCEMKLRQQNHGPVSGARTTDDNQLSP